MKVQTKLVRDGNSWSVRLPKQALKDSGLKPGSNVVLIAAPGKIAIYSTVKGRDKYDVAKQDARKVWDEAFEQVWLDLFGADE